MAISERWLEEIKVLDLTRYLAGPACTRLLTELGADVIKIEQPPYGDPNRSNRPRINKRAGTHIQQNRGKRSVCIDMNTDDGKKLILDLASHVDVVVENFSPGVLDRKGLGYGSLKRNNPKLIMASVSGFGQTGPLSSLPCFDLIAQGYAGIMHMTGEPDRPPMFVGIGMGDTNAGVHAFAAIGHALFHRERTGRGTHLDISMVDALFHMQDMPVHASSMTNGEYIPMRQGTEFQMLSPAGSFHGPEGWIVILCAEAQIANLYEAMGYPELANDERFKGNPARLENRAALTEIIEMWMSTYETDNAVLEKLQSHRVPCGPALAPQDALSHPHFLERGTVRTVNDPLAGEVQIPGFPFKSSDPLPDDDYVASALGEHNYEILNTLLGLSAERITDLGKIGVLYSKEH
ncbi:MAG: CoA transferase [Acidimicrobiales bacterium]|mgnify:CR=1 FL=1|nr:CoA transferase [Acidimicrobiales bacterium]HJM28800.1 CoA transferase [Acidimicrobiales bacterium]HJM98170.1 CoA transferase [Acidimicrobiales bacterium]